MGLTSEAVREAKVAAMAATSTADTRRPADRMVRAAVALLGQALECLTDDFSPEEGLYGAEEAIVRDMLVVAAKAAAYPLSDGYAAYYLPTAQVVGIAVQGLRERALSDGASDAVMEDILHAAPPRPAA